MTKTTTFNVCVPATSANLGTGFDSLGLALDLFASIEISFESEILKTNSTGGERLVLEAIQEFYNTIKKTPPKVCIKYKTALPLGRGLGSSASARVGGIMAANKFEGEPLNKEDCLTLATKLEGHPDNACPALFGGIQVCVKKGDDSFLHSACQYPDLLIALLIPDKGLATSKARNILPPQYSAEDAIHNSSHLALLVNALAENRIDLLDEAMNDRFHQPYRSKLFPPLYDLFSVAKEAGAITAWLSGAGSSVAAFCGDQEKANSAATAMLNSLENIGLQGKTIITKISQKGAYFEDIRP
jgi:homoserine kinase|tara:strand:+ start:1062 stop:1961 length:900 start_codon:yes stop_codon:yes gene_type:complete